ncbi:hypothetical protein TNCV_3960861 [Trichonephila clavipes]|nr:hypothetical protein TNCV_3960861 [Trichonephila clavipes]
MESRWVDIGWDVSSRSILKTKCFSNGDIKLWKQFQTMGTFVRRPGQGRPKAATPTIYRYLTINTRHHRQMTAK